MVKMIKCLLYIIILKSLNSFDILSYKNILKALYSYALFPFNPYLSLFMVCLPKGQNFTSVNSKLWIIVSHCLLSIKLKLKWVSLMFTLCKRDIFIFPLFLVLWVMIVVTWVNKSIIVFIFCVHYQFMI